MGREEKRREEGRKRMGRDGGGKGKGDRGNWRDRSGHGMGRGREGKGKEEGREWEKRGYSPLTSTPGAATAKSAAQSPLTQHFPDLAIS